MPGHDGPAGGQRPAAAPLRQWRDRRQRRLAAGQHPAAAGRVPDDGVLDVAVLAASGWAGWLRLAADVLLRRRTGRVAHLTCRELVIDASRARPWEVDGEVAGCTRQLRVTLEPGSLLIRVPAAARRLPAGLSALPRLALWIAAQQQDYPPLGGLAECGNSVRRIPTPAEAK